MLFWGSLSIAVGILLAKVISRHIPPKLTPMSTEWISHVKYQMLKPGGATDFYGGRRDE